MSQLVPPNITSEEEAQKFHTDDVSLHPDLGSVSDWSCCKGNLLNSTKYEHYLVMVSDMSSIWSGITAVIPQTSFHRATSDGFLKCKLFSQASDFAD